MFEKSKDKREKALDIISKKHYLFLLCTSRSYDEYKINYLNLCHAKLENRQFEKDFPFYQDIASSLYERGIKTSYIDCRVKYDHNTEFDFLFACKVKSKGYLVNIELTQNNDLKDGKKIKQLKKHNKFLSQFYSQYNIITLLVNKINNCKDYYLLDIDNDELQKYDFSQSKDEVEEDSNFKLDETTAINDFQCDWLTHEQYDKFEEIVNLDSSIKYVWLKGNAGCGKTTIGLKVYREENKKTILLKCAKVSEEESEKGIHNFTTFKNQGQIEQHYDFLIVDECQSIVDEQLQYIKENILNFDHIIFIGDEYQNYLRKREWSEYWKEISSNKKQCKLIVLNEYLRQDEDTINFFKYLCFNKTPKTRVTPPKFIICNCSFKNLPSLKHEWNKTKYNKEVPIGFAIGKTYKSAEVIIGNEFNNKDTMCDLYTRLTRTSCPMIFLKIRNPKIGSLINITNTLMKIQINKGKLPICSCSSTEGNDISISDITLFINFGLPTYETYLLATFPMAKAMQRFGFIVFSVKTPQTLVQ